MGLRIVRLGSPRLPGKGLRIGTVRRPPRRVRREESAWRDFFGVRLPIPAPSPETVKQALAAGSERELPAVGRRYRREMATGDERRVLDLLAQLSHSADASAGCDCEGTSR
ncbi:DUF488 domain-containing protein [Lysobacter sp. N42]|uniref:DUF488 family protein, N3 subclade n=1 Tax=Lysobacter sp. N42 TaxID=2545719 RepID=UPI00104BF9DB|nr:DUF488 domain-containing protein [Lysobacter sp. N42]TCZ82036.1 DUF488 domain-containing protein [Lysobacter sp. N42]